MKSEFLPEAEEEFREAAWFYEKEAPEAWSNQGLNKVCLFRYRSKAGLLALTLAAEGRRR